jgi:hypothetical protein
VRATSVGYVRSARRLGSALGVGGIAVMQTRPRHPEAIGVVNRPRRAVQRGFRVAARRGGGVAIQRGGKEALMWPLVRPSTPPRVARAHGLHDGCGLPFEDLKHLQQRDL